MPPSTLSFAKLLCCAWLALLVAGCGGGAGEAGDKTAAPLAAAPSAATTTGTKFIQAATVNADGPATVLTVRAHGTQVAGLGPMMQLRVDGVVIDTVPVQATEPFDYRFTVPAMQPGRQVDLVFTNDANVAGADRNLYVSQLLARDTAVVPGPATASIDRGTGDAAFDGVDLQPGGPGVYSNGALRLAWPAPNLTERLTVRASGTLAGGTGPVMALRVNGVTVGSTEVRSADPSDHVFAVPPLTPGSKVDVVYTNHGVVDGVARQLRVAYLMAGTTVLLPTASGVVIDAGSGLAAFDGQNQQPGQPVLSGNGALRAAWPAPNMTDRLTVRASGRLAGNVGPVMQLRVNGVVLGSTEVRSSVPTDFVFPSLPLQPGAQVDVALTNSATVDGVGRDLRVAYLMAGSTYLLPTAPGVLLDLGSGAAAFDGQATQPGQADITTAAALRGPWPSANLTDRLTVRARGTLAGNVGPVMQVLVDGVLVGSTEVRNTEYADHVFAVPTMQPGRKVDVVFTNDAWGNGVDRNLYVANLVSGNTFMLPSNPGVSYDRGAGALAFDGLDVIAGGEAMGWGGALRTTWPAANITDTVTVRASGTLAGNVGPILALRVDGVTVSSTEVRATTPTDHTLAVPPLKPGSRVEVLFTNPGTVDGTARQLNLAYLMAGSTVLLPTASGAAYNQGNLLATWPAANLTGSVTVRAHGVLAGNVGPVMQLRVDGVVVGSTEVRATEPTDYAFKVPPLKPGNKLDVVFTNDATVNGQNRDLQVSYLIAGNTFVLPTDASSVYDRGDGAAATDGADLLPGQARLAWNGALRLTWPAPNLTDRLTVRASGTLAGGTGPVMALRVDGVTVGSTEVRSADPADHVFAVPPLAPGSKVDVVYTNHAVVNGVARQLKLAYLMAGTTVLLPSASGVVIDQGSGEAAFDGASTLAGQPLMAANGALRAAWPAPNMTDRLTVRASGRLAGNVGPVMQVRVNGVVLGQVEVRATTPTDYSFAALPVSPRSQVEVVYTNHGTVSGVDRALNVAYLISGGTYLQPAMSGVLFDAGSGAAAFDGLSTQAGLSLLTTSGALRANWPLPNLTSSLIVHARGTLAGNVGPVMQLLVDGVMVGSAEVRSTSFSDYRFAVPRTLAGRKVEVVFTNDALINGEDRNLHVAYLVTADTYLVPTDANSVYDRGYAAAAFDGLELVTGRSTMSWNGALRATWPVANITENLTVRASASLAGDVGPVMAVRVDGVIVSSVEVRSPGLDDYQMPVPPLKPGSKIDVIFANDAVIDGADRNLTVAYLMAGNTVVMTGPSGVSYDLGTGPAAYDGVNLLPGQPTLALNGALRLTWPAPNVTDTLLVRASATLVDNVGAMMQLRVNGVVLGTVEVRATSPADYSLLVPRLVAGSKIDIAFTNDINIGGQDRNLAIQYLKVNGSTLVPSSPTVLQDLGDGEAAFDGLNTSAGTGALASNGALRFTVPAAPAADPSLPAKYAASRFLQQAGFGPTLADVNRLATVPLATWLDEQMAMPATPDFVTFVQGKFNLGEAYRPRGANYTDTWVGQRFWAAAANSPNPLRKRVAFALHQIFMVSQADSNLYHHSRAYAQYLDTLNQHAFGNFRTLLEEMALSPAMGIYLSHMRNRKEDPATGRLPDENFAREVMQLFTIGLHELNDDGSQKLDAQGNPIETYNNNDVMALAKVFTGWGWAFADNQLTEGNFRWGNPDYSAANDQKIDLLKMKPYPGQHSTAEKRLFEGRANAVVIPANSSAKDSLRIALDALFQHPNVGPFIGRQLIQRLVTSHPSPEYVARVAAKFNNNGAGVRGDLSAVVRAVLLDSEARTPPAAATGKLREPVLRVAHWLRSFAATSVTGHFMMAWELDNQSQRVMGAPSVFGYFRPGFVPPNTAFSANRITVPELQIVNESTTASWVNTAMAMAGNGLGWNGTASDVTSALQPLAALSAEGQVDGLIERINLLLLAGRMSSTLRADLLEAIATVPGNSAESHLNRARVALFLALVSPEYLVQH